MNLKLKIRYFNKIKVKVIRSLYARCVLNWVTEEMQNKFVSSIKLFSSIINFHNFSITCTTLFLLYKTETQFQNIDCQSLVCFFILNECTLDSFVKWSQNTINLCRTGVIYLINIISSAPTSIHFLLPLMLLLFLYNCGPYNLRLIISPMVSVNNISFRLIDLYRIQWGQKIVFTFFYNCNHNLNCLFTRHSFFLT